MLALFMRYTQYKTEQFIYDEFFVNWVIDPDEESDFFWRSFLENHPAKQRELLEAREIIELLKDKQTVEFDHTEEEREALFERIVTTRSISSATDPSQSTGFYSQWISVSWIGRVAAVLLLGVILAALYYQINERVPIPAAVVSATISKETDLGQKLTFQLEDGTEVMLNAGSKLTFRKHFVGSRDVYLEGEAFFKVARDRTRPFIVHTMDMETTVLGTSFNIKENRLKDRIEVSVLTGKVAVKAVALDSHNSMELHPTQMGVYSPQKRTLTNLEFDYDKVLSWKDNVLFFQDASFEEVLDQLQRWYGVTIIVKKAINNRKGFQGRYEDKTLETVLTGIGFAYGFDFDIEDDVVIIK